MHSYGDVSGIFHHICQQLAKHRIMQSIDVFVAFPHPQRLLDVAVLIAVNDRAKLFQNSLGHVSQLNRNFIGKFPSSNLLRALSDVAGKVTDALQIGCNPQSPHNLPQIDRQRLTPCDGFDCLGFDCPLQFVDRFISSFYISRQTNIFAEQCVERIADLLFGLIGHFNDFRRQFPQIGVKGQHRVPSHGQVPLNKHVDREPHALGCHNSRAHLFV
jgi:hypothetical protein